MLMRSTLTPANALDVFHKADDLTKAYDWPDGLAKHRLGLLVEIELIDLGDVDRAIKIEAELRANADAQEAVRGIEIALNQQRLGMLLALARRIRRVHPHAGMLPKMLESGDPQALLNW